MADAPPDISVVVPVYGCAGAITELHRRLTTSLQGMDVSYELLFVEDASPDDSWSVLEQVAASDPAHVGIYRHTRNFGQHAAITGGLARARGRWIVVMDCDLQDPPELLPTLWQRALDGSDVVWARQNAKVTSGRRDLGGRIYYGMLGRVAGVHIDAHQGTFSLISRRVCDAVLSFKDVDRNYVFLLTWLGFASVVVEYDRDERFEGQSSYTLRALIRHAVSGLVFQTTVLLRYVIYLGFLFAAVGIGFAVYITISKVAGARSPGWTSLAVFTLTTGGVVMTCLGITGLYIGKIFDQVRGRPLSVFADEHEPATAPDDAAKQTAVIR
jgi:glycosyltransferase involved in cell wall biosynthesis